MKLTHLYIPALCTIACGAARAQSELHTFWGPTAGDQAGHAVAGIGDVDNDGHADILVGAPYDETFGYRTGRATVYSGATGAVLYSFTGAAANEEFGSAVAPAGDVNEDGRPDFVVGARSALSGGVHKGMARVYSGTNGSILWSWYGDSNGDLFGSAVIGGFDVDADGYADVIVGAPGDDNTGLDSGSVRVFSGRTGGAFNTFNGTVGSEYGSSVALVGDLTTDGKQDFAVGAPFAMNAASQVVGRVWVYDGVTGAIAWAWSGDQTGEQFGCSIAGGLDADFDGYSDVLVGAQADDFAGNDAGSVAVYSGRTGQRFTTFYGSSANDRLGCSVACLGDLTGDGVRDMALGAGAQAMVPGYVSVRSGMTGYELYRLLGDSNLDHLGCSVADAGDVNGDGTRDIALGAEYADHDGVLETGLARVCSGKWLQPVTYCTAKTNSQGCVPNIYTGGIPSYSNTLQGFSILADHIINQRPGVLVYGMHKATTPFYGGTLCVQGPLTRTKLTNSNGSTLGTDCTGTLAINFSDIVQGYTDPRLTPGRMVYAQWWYRDGQSTGGTGLSDAVSFAIAP